MRCRFVLISVFLLLLCSCSSKKQITVKTVDYRNVYQYLDNYLIFDNVKNESLNVTTDNGSIKRDTNNNFILNFDIDKRTSLFISQNEKLDTIILNTKAFPNPEFKMGFAGDIEIIDGQVRLEQIKNNSRGRYATFLPDFMLDCTWKVESLNITRIRNGQATQIRGFQPYSKLSIMSRQAKIGDQYFINDIACRLNDYDKIVYAKSINFEIIE